MSKSKPESCIDLPEDIKKVTKKIMRAKTGGRKTVEEQKKLGGEPEKCIIFELYKQHLIEDDKKLQKVYDDCKAGKLLCGEDKQNCVGLMAKFMEELTTNIEKARKNIDKINLVTFK